MADEPLLVYVAHEYPPRSQTFVFAEASAVRATGRDVWFYPMRPQAGTGDVSWVVSWRRSLAPRVVLSAAGRIAYLVAVRPRALVRHLSLPPRTARQAARTVKAVLLASVLASLVARRPHRGPVHLHAHFFGLMSQVALLAREMLPGGAAVTVSVMGHAADVVRPRSVARLRYEAGQADFVVCASDFVRRSLLAQTTVTAAEVVRCGVAGTRSRRAAPAGGPLRVVSVARLVEKKGLDVAVRAFADLTRAGTEVSLLIVGDGPERGRLADLVAAAGLEDRVTLLGARPPAEVLDIIASEADLFVLPCRVARDGDVDGIPVALMEAMSVGVPVVTTPTGGITELVRDGETGYLVRPDDPAALAETVRRVVARPDEARAIGDAGRSYVRSHHCLQDEAAKLVRSVADATRSAAAPAVTRRRAG